MTTIDDLLRSLQSPIEENKKFLPNNEHTWSRIGSKDKFKELGLSDSELESFLSKWMADNPYSNL